MADLGTIGIAIEVRGREALRQIENDMTLVDRSAKSAARSFEVFERAGLKTAETFRYVSDAAKKRLSDEERITRELIKQRDAAEQLAKANAQAFQSQIGPNLGLGAQGISASGSASAMEAEIERLRQKYDKIYASSQLYEASLKELNQAHLLGVTSTKQHEEAVERLNAEYQAFQNGTAGVNNRFAQGIQQTGAGINNMGVLIQQLGYQAGDFAVQVQSGTSAFVAFGQQATQLVGFLPMLAQELNIAKFAFMGLSIPIAPLMLGLSILVPTITAIGAAWMRTTEANGEAEQKLTDLEERVKSLRKSLEEYARTKEALAKGITLEEATGAESYEQSLQALIDAERNLAQVRSSANELAAGMSAAGGFFISRAEEAAATASLAEAEQKVAEARQTLFDLSQKLLDTYQKESKTLAFNAQLEEARLRYGEDSAKVKALEAQAERDVYEESLRRLGLNQAFITALLNQYDQTVKNKQAAEQSRKEAEKFRDTLLSVAKIDISSVFKNAAGPLNTLLSGAEELLKKAVALAYIESNQQGGTSYLANQYSLYGQGKASSRQTVSEAGSLYTPFPVPEDSASMGGGGSGGTLGVENKLEEIYKYLELDNYLKEQETLAYEQRQDVLRTALDNKLITLEEYNQLEKDLMSKHYLELANIENQAQMSKLSTVLGAGEQILQAVGQHNEKAAKMARVFGAAQALADTYAGAAAALKLPFPKNLAAAASIISAGLGFVSAIKSGSTSGARPSVGGGGVGSATVAASSAPTPQTVFIDSVDPDSLYSGQTLINLFDAFYNENDKRGKVFVVAR